MEQQIFDLLLGQEEITWKTILFDLIKSEQMDPWDINITLLTQKYIEIVKTMQENNLRISGKILLAAAFMLKMKSEHLVEVDLAKFDNLINQTEDELWGEEGMDAETIAAEKKKLEKFNLVPRNPQPRNRKVSIHDLVEALQQAMTSKKKVLARIRPVKFNMPTRKVDIMEVIRDVYHKLLYYNNQNEGVVTFTKLLPANPRREDKVYTFLPLLHLQNHQKIDMEQEKPFEEIYIKLASNFKETVKEVKEKTI